MLASQVNYFFYNKISNLTFERKVTQVSNEENINVLTCQI